MAACLHIGNAPVNRSRKSRPNKKSSKLRQHPASKWAASLKCLRCKTKINHSKMARNLADMLNGNKPFNWPFKFATNSTSPTGWQLEMNHFLGPQNILTTTFHLLHSGYAKDLPFKTLMTMNRLDPGRPHRPSTFAIQEHPGRSSKWIRWHTSRSSLSQPANH